MGSEKTVKIKSLWNIPQADIAKKWESDKYDTDRRLAHLCPNHLKSGDKQNHQPNIFDSFYYPFRIY